MADTPTIEVAAFLRTIDATKNPKFGHHLKEAINWLGQRVAYSQEYHRQIKRLTTRRKMQTLVLLFDHTHRIRIESAVLAFLQNIHAACDAFPFALHIMMGGLSKKADADDDHFKWNLDLLKSTRTKCPEADELHAALEEFMADENFKILAALVNQAKHKYFPRIVANADLVNDRYRLLMRDVEYHVWPKGEKKQTRTLDELDVLEFMKAAHNVTLLKLFHLYVHAYNAVKTQECSA